jgi:hypothetical protein
MVEVPNRVGGIVVLDEALNVSVSENERLSIPAVVAVAGRDVALALIEAMALAEKDELKVVGVIFGVGRAVA